MDKPSSFRQRMDNCSKNKNSKIVLALDPLQRDDLIEFVKMVINLVEKHICAIKINFHLILPLSLSQMSEINDLAHSYGLQSIADIKLNDIPKTNEIAIEYLLKVGFDAIIVNPFMGKEALQSATSQAHQKNGGIIALVYMSHPGAKEGFGRTVINHNDHRDQYKSNNRITMMYKVFLEYAYACHVDGMVVGATKVDILKEISSEKQIPIYSPGFGTQGGDIQEAAKNGTDYFIIGSSIICSNNPLNVIEEIRRQISCV
jgi:orotidine-5'-phosphate decarboxylase